MANKNVTRCKCGANSNVACKNCSVIKMVILIDNQYGEYRSIGKDGKRYNDVWYSILKQNNRPINKIIEGMIRRFNNSEKAKYTYMLQFYDNRINKLIYQYYPNEN